jgi:hypothetical protein
MRLSTLAIAASLAVVVSAGCSSTQSASQGGEGGANLTVTPEVRAMANNPSPPATAQRKSSIGQGSLTIHTANSANDTDSFWVQQLDINGDGTLEWVSVLWDDEDKALFLYGEEDFPCRNGGMGMGAILIGLNGPNNPRGRPVGSGFYAVLLDESECGARTAGIWGCRFDANGNASACGWAVIDATNDDVTVTTVVVN